MIRAKDQLEDEATYPNLAKFLRAGGTLEIGEDWSLGGFARVRMGNQTLVIANAAYQDFGTILKEMDSLARGYFERRP